MLLTVAGLRGVRADALLNVDNYVLERKGYEPHRDIVAQGTDRMIRIALRALPALAEVSRSVDRRSGWVSFPEP